MNKYLLLLICVLAIVSCRSNKDLTDKAAKVRRMAPQDLLDSVALTQNDFVWFTGKAKVKYNDGDRSQNFTANIRMKKDSIIWISITSLMGIEAARITIDQDSIRILDRLKKRYVVEPSSKSDQYLPFDLDLGLVQNLLAGNFLWTKEGKLRSKVDGGLHVLFIDNKTFESTFLVRPTDHVILNLLIEELGAGREVLVNVSDFELEDGRLVGTDRHIEFKDKKGYRLQIDMDYSRMKWDEPTSFPFYVSDKYD